MFLKSPLKLLNWSLEIITKNIAPKLYFYRGLVGQHNTVQNGVTNKSSLQSFKTATFLIFPLLPSFLGCLFIYCIIFLPFYLFFYAIFLSFWYECTHFCESSYIGCLHCIVYLCVKNFVVYLSSNCTVSYVKT